MDPRAYDLVVLGSGAAGEKGAVQIAYFGRKVAIVERASSLGGAAANTGTLPSKTLRETALMLSGLRARDLHGLDVSLRQITKIEDLLRHEVQVKELERARIARNMRRYDVDCYNGTASFTDPHTIKVESEGKAPVLLRGEYILIATGSSPRRPELFPFEHPRVWDSDQVLALDFMPRRLLVVGAGVIGSEYACIFAALGARVFLVDGRDHYIGFLDKEVSSALKSEIQAMGVEFIAPDRVTACSPSDAAVILELASGRRLHVDAVLVAAGRTSNTEALNLPAVGIEPGRRGLIEVDEWYRTQVPNIYAAGDVIGFPALASTSMEQARIAMDHAFQLDYITEQAPSLPFGIYTIPEVSMVGETEETLRDKGIDYVVGRASYGVNARGVIIGDYDGFLKLLFRRQDMRLIGVHIIGDMACELIHVGLIALQAEVTSEFLIRVCFNYPSLSNLYKYATYDAMGAAPSP